MKPSASPMGAAMGAIAEPDGAVTLGEIGLPQRITPTGTALRIASACALRQLSSVRHHAKEAIVSTYIAGQRHHLLQLSSPIAKPDLRCPHPPSPR